MKTLLINLLILVALALAGFNALQWYREAKLHGDVNRLGEEVYKRSAEIQGLQLNLKANLEEIKRLEGIRENFTAIVKSNRTVVAQLEEQSDKFRRDLQVQTAKVAQIEQYKAAFDKANENLKKANEVIVSQNEKTKQLADDRNEAVTRLNKLAGEYNSLGDDYRKVLGMYTNLVAEVKAANEKNSRK